MKKIIVTGSSGQVGSEIKTMVDQYPQYQFIFTDREMLPLQFFSNANDQNKEPFRHIKDFFEEQKPDYWINCAAYTAVNKAETNEEQADIINHLAVDFIATCCMTYHCKLIHISTDYVFDGRSPILLTEKAETRPINVYGRTKLKGERACIKNNPESIIIRTAWVYSEFGHNFVKTMIKLMNERDAIDVVDDQVGSPTYAADLARVILDIITRPTWISGIYHYSNEGKISWFDFAITIKKIIGSKCFVRGVSTSDYPTPAKRPAYSLLDKTKISKTYNINIPYYEDSLKICIANLVLN